MIVTAGLELIVVLRYKSSKDAFLLRVKNAEAHTGEDEKSLQSSIVRRKKSVYYHTQNKVHILDSVFRFLAPVVYVVFCIVYFGYYFGKEE